MAALEDWPAGGVPDNPGAWLMAVAKRRALDRLRHDSLAARKHEEIARDAEALGAGVVPDVAELVDAARADPIGDDLLRLIFAASPVVRLNRAVAVGMAQGPAAGLAMIDALDAAALAGYPWLPAVRGDLLARLGRAREARAQFERAAELTGNRRDRESLLRRAQSLQAVPPDTGPR